MASSSAGSKITIQNGQIAWFDGPEWDDVVQGVFEIAQESVEENAKANAPWEDRTGDARAGLQTRVVKAQGSISLFLEHTVEYGLWLEVIQNGRFAIIMPTLEAMAPEIFLLAGEAANESRHGTSFSL